MKRRFFNGWLLFAYVVLLLPVPYFYKTIYLDNTGYTWHQFLWLVGAALFVTGVRAYQYFIQKR